MPVSIDDVARAVQELVSVGVMPADSREVVEARRDLLLSDLADQVLLAEEQVRVQQGAERSICIFESWRALLKRCRQDGLEAAFASQEQMKQVETALAAFNLSAGNPIRIISESDPHTGGPLDPASYAKLIAALIRPALPHLDTETQAVSIAFLQAELAYALAWLPPDPNSDHLDEAIQAAAACLPLLSNLELWRRLGRARLALGLACLSRHELSGRETDLEAGILNCQQAGYIFVTHYQDLQDENTLNLGVYAQQRAEAAAPRDAYDWPKRRYNLGFAHYHRYKAPRFPAYQPGRFASEVEADPGDLDQAVQMIREAAAPAVGDDLDTYQSDLATMLWERYDLSGGHVDLAESIDIQRAVLGRTAKSRPEWGIRRGNLGIALHARFQSQWQIEDLDEAIQALQDALDAASPEGGYTLTWQSNLSVALRTRYEATGELADLDAAILLWGQVLEATPEGDGSRPLRQYNLGLALMSRFDLTGAPQDILDAVAAFEGALAQVSRGDHRWTDYIADLGVAYRRRYDVSQDVEDLDRSIACLRKALEAEPKSSSSIPRWAANIGRTFLLRYRLGGEAEVLKAAQSSLSIVVQMLPPRARDWAEAQADLGTVMNEVYQRTRDEQDLAKAIQSYQAVLEAYAPEEWPEQIGLSAAALGGIYFSRADWKQAAETFALADQAFELLYQRQLFSAGRESWITRLGAFYPQYAYALARLGDLQSAALVMERSRARSLNEALERDQSDLRSVGELDPPAYQQFQDAVNALRQIAAFERAGQRTAAPGEAGLTLQQITANAHRELDQAVERIRRLPWFEAFLASPDLQDLQAAARPGQPLAYLLATPLGGLALVVHLPDPGGPVSIRPLWMDDFTDGTLRAFLLRMEDDQVSGGYLPGQIARPDWLKRALSEDLPGVGKKLLPPLADHLQSQSAAGVTLIPGGLLSLLPLHAAGAPPPSQQTGLLEHWPVRYAPSARVLAAGIRLAAEADRSPQAAPSLAGVGNPLPAARPLAFARLELEAIAGLFAAGASHVLYEQDATLQNLKDACMGANYLHFSCHGRFEPQQALESSLILSGQERLTLRSLLDEALDLSHVRLVVLSACQTGIADFTRLPDEAVGLPAGFLQAGVPGVVSSLWPVDDLSTTLLMDRFYRLHLQDGLEPAEALRQAQLWLRGSTTAELGLHAWYQQRFQRSGRRDALAYKLMRYYAINADLRPFEHPYYWAGFIFSGV